MGHEESTLISNSFSLTSIKNERVSTVNLLERIRAVSLQDVEAENTILICELIQYVSLAIAPVYLNGELV